MPYRLLMYSRTTSCPFVSVAKRVLARHGVPYEEIFIDQDAEARARVVAWTGFQSVPTLVVAEEDSLLPVDALSELAPGASPRGIDRGPMITEPSSIELEHFLTRHGFITDARRTG